MCSRSAVGSGLPTPSRRTFTPGILPSAHSKETSLRPPGSARFPTPLDWHGQPLAGLPRSTGFQPVCVLGSHQPSHVIPEGRAVGSEARAEAGETCAPPGCAEGKGNRTHTPQVGRRPHSRRRRACLRPAAVPQRQATITCEPYGASAGRMPADARPGLFGTGWKPVLRTETPGSRLPGPWMGWCRAGESLRAFGGLRICRQDAGRRPARIVWHRLETCATDGDAGLKAAGAMDGPAAVYSERQAVLGEDVAAFISVEAPRDFLRQHLQEHSAKLRLRTVG